MNVNSSATLDYAQLLAQSMQNRNSQANAAATDFSLTTVEVTVTETASQSQTVEDVKREFYDYLDSLSISAGLGGAAISVNVTEAAFEKMLADPDYKQKMKDLCARDICDPAWNNMAAMGLKPSALVVTIDADCEEEYLATSYNYPEGRSKADGDSFWSRRTKNAKAAREDQEEAARERREILEFIQERGYERKRLQNETAAAGWAGGGEAAYSVSSYRTSWSGVSGTGIAALS